MATDKIRKADRRRLATEVQQAIVVGIGRIRRSRSKPEGAEEAGFFIFFALLRQTLAGRRHSGLINLPEASIDLRHEVTQLFDHVLENVRQSHESEAEIKVFLIELLVWTADKIAERHATPVGKEGGSPT